MKADRTRLRARLGRARRSLAYDAEGAVRGFEGRLDQHQERLAALERDLARIGPQVAALEARLEDLRSADRVPASDGDGLETARSLVEEIRREHLRMRARVSAASRFEERLEQVEEIVAALPSPTQ